MEEFLIFYAPFIVVIVAVVIGFFVAFRDDAVKDD